MIDLPEKVKEIVRDLHTKGGHCYLVGGFVRDLQIKIPSKDIDIEVHELSPAQIRLVLHKHGDLNFIGKSFGIYSLKGLDVDLSLPRKEKSTGPGHKKFKVDVDPSLGLERALERRDFTINAMAISMKDWNLIDPYKGKRDLKANRLNMVSSKSFKEDPLRVLRGMQFCSRFKLEASAETRIKAREMVESYYSLPKERVWSELKKFLLKGKNLEKGLTFLRQTNWIHHWPELATCFYCPQDKKHHPEGNVGTHILEVLARAVKIRESVLEEDQLTFMLACLLHDVGKPSTTVTHENGSITSHGHDNAGEVLVRTFLGRLTNEQNLIDKVAILVRKHMFPHYCRPAKDAAFRRLQKEVDPFLLGKVCEADGLTPENKEHYYKMIKRVGKVSPAGSNKTVVQGRHLILYGLQPSPQFSKIIQKCEEIFLETGERQPHILISKVMKSHNL